MPTVTSGNTLAACYMVGEFATLTILTKNALMESMAQDYIRTAFAKGLRQRRVIFVHALRNSLIPLATGLGSVFSLILAGSFLIEKVFNIDGMGYLGYNAILQRDYPVALGILVISSMLMRSRSLTVWAAFWRGIFMRKLRRAG